MGYQLDDSCNLGGIEVEVGEEKGFFPRAYCLESSQYRSEWQAKDVV